jgi:hypothetical protein
LRRMHAIPMAPECDHQESESNIVSSSILQGLRKRNEEHHGTTIDDASIVHAPLLDKSIE